MRAIAAHRVAAGPLLVVVDEDVVPSDCSHVKCVKRAKDPQKRDKKQRCEEDVEAAVEAAAARGTLLEVGLLLDGREPVSVHLEMDVEALSLVLAILDGPRHRQEAVTRGGG